LKIQLRTHSGAEMDYYNKGNKHANQATHIEEKTTL